MGHMEGSPQNDFQLWGHIYVQDLFHMVLSQFGLIEFHWTATTPFKHTFQDSQESPKKHFLIHPPLCQAVTSYHPCNMSYSHKFSFKGEHEQDKGSKSKFVSLRTLLFIFLHKSLIKPWPTSTINIHLKFNSRSFLSLNTSTALNSNHIHPTMFVWCKRACLIFFLSLFTAYLCA